jgi:hypothetical protein
MRNTLLLFAAIALTVLCWGLYGPVLQTGQMGMSTTNPPTPVRLRPFVCVGLAYFLIGVIVPWLWLYLRGEKGDWTLTGMLWSFAGGAVGAIGALGIILAMTFGGHPIYVMPLVFGGAPVVNAFLTIYMARRLKEIGSVFLAGLIIVVIGAVVVLVSAPHAAAHAVKPAVGAQAEAAAGIGFWTWMSQLLSIALTIVCWGAYGPVLHRGQAAMHHSRMRPLICVGLAYFFIAVVVPNMILAESPEASTYASWGTIWAIGAGAFGAAGALGIIMAFNAGGRPIFVMPLVFGGAPVVNSLYSVTRNNLWGQISPLFWAGLILVIAGAAIVLVFAPRGESGRAPKAESREPKIEGEGRKAEGGIRSEPVTGA